jgi:LmbE family N-acetylglucosaminyl deacetylase
LVSAGDQCLSDSSSIPYEAELLKLLCITAHPDDEVGSFAGTLLQCVRRGIETQVVCLTDGQAATHRGNARNGEELGRMRREEFANACKLLRVTRTEVLEYPDSALDRVSLFDVVGVITKRIRQIRPQVIATLGMEGGATGHPDHSMTAIFATMAFHWAGRANRYVEQLEAGLKPHQAQKLYQATYDFTLSGRQPVSMAPTTAIIEVGDIVETKIEAFAMHVSQRPLLPMFTEMIRKRGKVERFHLAATSKPSVLALESDLFEGVSDE